jgi:hypothetical protein
MCQTESCPHLFRDLGGQRPRQGQGGGRSEAHADAHRKSSSCDQRWCSGTASLRVSATPAFLMPIRRKRTPSPKALISCDLQARPPGSDCRERDGQDLRDPCRCRSRSTSSPGPGRRSRTRPAARRSAAGTRSATCHFLLESRPEVRSAHPGRHPHVAKPTTRAGNHSDLVRVPSPGSWFEIARWKLLGNHAARSTSAAIRRRDRARRLRGRSPSAGSPRTGRWCRGGGARRRCAGRFGRRRGSPSPKWHRE